MLYLSALRAAICSLRTLLVSRSSLYNWSRASSRFGRNLSLCRYLRIVLAIKTPFCYVRPTWVWSRQERLPADRRTELETDIYSYLIEYAYSKSKMQNENKQFCSSFSVSRGDVTWEMSFLSRDHTIVNCDCKVKTSRDFPDFLA